MLQETAYAKINLALHVRRKREDGYHEIETLFAFVDKGDKLTARAAERDGLRLCGEFAPALASDDNLVMQALSALPREQSWSITLQKNLPVAAGLGGGSADAAAIFRMVRRERGLPENWAAIAERLGADVPACVESRTAVGKGTGAHLTAAAHNFGNIAVLLVNPRVQLSTASVFEKWDGVDRGALPLIDSPYQLADMARNDLEGAAIDHCPVVAEVLELLGRTNPILARMSGSGATCFAIYAVRSTANGADGVWGGIDDASAYIRAVRPHWWTLSGSLR